MGLLQWIFGDDEERRPLTGEKMINRAPRVVMTPLHDIFLELKAKKVDGIRRIVNISASGVGLLNEGDRRRVPVGSALEGVVVYKGQEFPVNLQVVQNLSASTGYAFIGDVKSIGDIVSLFFELELSATKLAEVKTRRLKNLPDGNARLFQNADDSELFFVEGANGISRFHLTFQGNHLSYDPDNGLKYGKIVTPTKQTMPQSPGTDLVRFEPDIPTEIIHKTIKFISNIRLLPEKQRELFTELITSQTHGRA